MKFNKIKEFITNKKNVILAVKPNHLRVITKTI